MYHDIREVDASFFPKRYSLPSFITPTQFEYTLQKIQQKKGILYDGKQSFSEVFNSDHHFNILTFDDGLIDHLAIAKNLVGRKISAIFSIPYAPVFQSKVINSHKIQFVLASVDHRSLVKELKKHFYENNSAVEDAEIDKFFISRWKNNVWSPEMVFLTRVLREAGTHAWRESALNYLFAKYVSADEAGFAAEFYLSKKDIDNISDMGHIIAGHGNYSLDLRFEDTQTIKDEISISKDLISRYADKEYIYTYANGGWTPLALKLLSEKKFSFAMCTDNIELPKKLNYLNGSKFLLPRIDATKLI